MSDIESMDDLPVQPNKGNYEVFVGDEERPVSVQLIQQIFNEVTGRAESLTENFKKSYQIEFSHIQDLYTRLHQTLDQFTVVSENCGIVVYYLDNSKDEFSSFERFAFQNAGATSPVESIYMKYNFLIVPTKTRKTQTYTINIRIASGVALRKRLEDDDILNGPPIIFRLMRNRPAYSKIEYVDYSVARTMQAVIRDWFSIIPHDEEQKVISFIQKRSHMIPRMLRYIGVITAGIVCIQEIAKHAVQQPINEMHTLQVGIVVFIIMYTTFAASGWIGEYSENRIDRWSTLSYLNFNKADEIEIQKYKAKNKKSVIKALIGFILALCTSIVTKVLASLIISYVFHSGS